MIARRPQVALVDELAHTNVPGSRNEKRWQDIDELLAAGIDVLSTVNVQHLESLNDVVEKITGVRQRETVPDEWVRAAEQVELVDITPEALRRRMAHGNTYRPEKIDAAVSNYFKPVNLVALRELALLWVADEVDVALQRYRAEQHITEVWEARERVVVAVAGGPESETVLRQAARIAKRSGSAELLCVHVLRSDGLAGAPPAALARLRRLADDVGASFHTVVGGDDVPAALLDFALGANATQLVLGTSRRSRPARLFNEGIGSAVVQDSGSIDVHMVTHPEAGGRPLVRTLGSALPRDRRVLGWALAALLPVLATLVGVGARSLIGLSTDVVLFFLATVLVALVGGLGPALLAAVAGGLMLNWFLTPPLHTFTIAGRENLITLVAMVLVAAAVALVVDRASRRAEQAARARTEAALLASFARTVLAPGDPLPGCRRRSARRSGCVRWRCWSGSTAAGTRRPGSARRTARARRTPRSMSRWSRGCTWSGGAGRWPPPTAACWTPPAGRRCSRCAAGGPPPRPPRPAAAPTGRAALGAALGGRARPAHPADLDQGRRRQSARPELDLSAADRAELLATVEESADRLTGLVDNLLDSSRLAAGAVVSHAVPVGYDEVVALALTGVEGAERVAVEMAESLPDVLADPGLLERVVANVVDNALRHGRGAPVAVRASAHADRVELRVVDSGPGVPRAAADGLFAPFRRLGDRGVSGVGLGLSVARGFTEAMGGTLAAEDTPGGGLTVVVSLPVAPASSPAEGRA